MIVLLLALSGLVGSLLTGGRFGALADLRLRLPGVAVAVVIAQAVVLELPAHAPVEALHLLTYALGGIWLYLNRRTTGIPAIMLGGLLNTIPIVANGGVMPASPDAAAVAGLTVDDGFANSAPTADAALWWLGDVFAIPARFPLANVFSVGDVVLALGVAALLWTASRPAVRDSEDTAPGRLATLAATLTGLPARSHTVGIIAITGTATAGCVAMHLAIGGRTDSVTVGVAVGLLVLTAVAEAVPIAHDGENHTSTNLLMVLTVITAPTIAIPGIAVAVLVGQGAHRLRFTRAAGQHSPPRLATYKAVNAAACDTLFAALVGTAAAVLVGNDPADPTVWLAAAAASILYDIALHPVVATLIALASGRRPTLRALQPANVPATLVTAAPAPLLCLIAAHGPGWALLPLTVPMAAWSATADRYVRHTDWLAADHVTGLSIRQQFLVDADTARSGTHQVVVLRVVDLIGIEQAVGTAAASRVMARFAERLVEQVKGHTVGHVSRDTLAVACPPAAIPTHTLTRALSGNYDLNGLTIPVEVVAGLSGPSPDAAADLLLRAEAALDQGHGPVRTHTSAMAMSTREELVLAAELRDGFEQGQIVPWYQPIMSAGDRPTMVAAEALARWNHPRDGVLAPGVWLAKASRLGLDQHLTGLIIDAVCADIAQWVATHDAAVHVHVNATAWDLAAGQLTGQVASACARNGIDPSWLTVEFTEESAMVDQDATSQTIKRLHELGCRVAIDDFGVGHSSLGRLAMFDIDELKIDRAMIRDAHTHPRVVSVLAALIKLGHDLDMRVVAEGVENARDVRLMTSLGVDKLQGFGLGRPSDATTFIVEADTHGETMPASAPDDPAGIGTTDRARRRG